MDSFANLDGKVALVTGAGVGIGRACAELLAKGGAKVMLSDIDIFSCEKTAQAMKDEGFDVACCELNVTNESEWQRAVDATLTEFGGLDILVNNAGIYVGGLVLTNSLEQVRKVQEVNVDSIFLGTKACAAAMKPDGAAGNGGSIINISSVAGLVGVPGHSAYGASKGAVRTYTKHCAVEFGLLQMGIRVNSVHPGLIATAMGEQVYQDFIDCGLAKDRDEAIAMVAQMTPVGREGNVQEVANVVRFLASDAASYITGAEYVVDGGLSAG